VRRPGLIVVVLFVALTAFRGVPAAGQTPRIGDPAPDVAGERWVNGGPLTTEGLRGRVVLVEFWTYG